MGPSQICGCPFREPRVFTIAQVKRAGIPKVCEYQGHVFTCDSCQTCEAGSCIGLTCDEKCRISCIHGHCAPACTDSSLSFFSTEFKVPLTLYCGPRACQRVSVTASNKLRLTVTLNFDCEMPKSIKTGGCLVLKCSNQNCDYRVLDQIDLQLGSKVRCMAVNCGDYNLPAACRDKKALSCGTDLVA